MSDPTATHHAALLAAGCDASQAHALTASFSPATLLQLIALSQKYGPEFWALFQDVQAIIAPK